MDVRGVTCVSHMFSCLPLMTSSARCKLLVLCSVVCSWCVHLCSLAHHMTNIRLSCDILISCDWYTWIMWLIYIYHSTSPHDSHDTSSHDHMTDTLYLPWLIYFIDIIYHMTDIFYHMTNILNQYTLITWLLYFITWLMYFIDILYHMTDILYHMTVMLYHMTDIPYHMTDLAISHVKV